MDIPAVAMVLSNIELQQSVGTELLGKILEDVEGNGNEMAKMLEHSVISYKGNSIDVLV